MAEREYQKIVKECTEPMPWRRGYVVVDSLSQARNVLYGLIISFVSIFTNKHIINYKKLSVSNSLLEYFKTAFKMPKHIILSIWNKQKIN